MSVPRVTYVPRADATPGSELNALASVYQFILRCGEARRAAEKKVVVERALLDDRDDAKESNGRAATRDYTA